MLNTQNIHCRSSTSGTLRFYSRYFLKEKIYQNSVNGIKFYAIDKPIQTKFEAIAPKDVEQVAFLAKAVLHERFQIKEAISFDSHHLW